VRNSPLSSEEVKKEIQIWDNKYVLVYSPHGDSDHISDEHFTKHKGYRPSWLRRHIWFYDDKQDALNNAIEFYEKMDKKKTLTIHFGEKSLIHDKLQILSSFGINLASKLAEDVDQDHTSIRITEAAFDKCPKEGFEKKNASISGNMFGYWEKK